MSKFPPFLRLWLMPKSPYFHIIALFSIFSLVAQGQRGPSIENWCFDIYIQEGKDSLASENFTYAMQNFRSALACPKLDTYHKDLALTLWGKANQRNIRRLDSLRLLAERSKEVADSLRRRAEGDRVADRAAKMLEEGLKEDALKLVFWAKQLFKNGEPPTAIVREAFGSVVVDSFAKTYQNPLTSNAIYQAGFFNKKKKSWLVSREKKMKILSEKGEIFAESPTMDDYILSTDEVPDVHQITLGTKNGEIAIWQPEQDLFQIFSAHQGAVYFTKFSPDGAHFISGGKDGQVILWNKEGQQIKKWKAHEGRVYAGHFSPNGERILTRGSDGMAGLWDLNGTLVKLLNKHEGRLYDAQFSPDGNQIITCGAEGDVMVWDGNGNFLEILSSQNNPVYRVHFSHRGQYFATFSANESPRIWKRESGILTSTVPVPNDQITLLPFSFEQSIKEVLFAPNDDALLTWSGGNVQLIDLTGQITQEFWAHKRILTAAFSPKGDKILTTAQDKTAKLWNVEGELLMHLKQHEAAVIAGNFSSDGTQISTYGKDGKLVICPIPAVIYETMSEQSIEISEDFKNRYSLDN